MPYVVNLFEIVYMAADAGRCPFAQVPRYIFRVWYNLLLARGTFSVSTSRAQYKELPQKTGKCENYP